MTTTNTERARIHPWEAAGLGKAPFRWLGVEERRGPILVSSKGGVETWVGSPGQPMGCCKYCHQGIAECHLIRSADGKEFIVGCDCVARCNSKGSPVLTAAEKAHRKHARELRHTRERVRIEEGRAFLALPETQAVLASKPHPQDWRAAQGETLADMVAWYMDNAGTSGRLWAIGVARKAVR